MQGKREVAKTSAKVIELEQKSDYDSTIIDHSNGKASVSEIRFAGKRNALELAGAERASMDSSSK